MQLRRSSGLALAMALTAPAVAHAETITLEVGFAAGGTSSAAAQALRLSVDDPGVTVVVENKPGASGLVAAQYVERRSASDVLLFMSATSALKVRPDLGLVPIGIVATFDYVAVVRKDGPQSLEEYMRDVRTNDTLRNVSTAGAGSVAHLIGAQLFEDHDATMVHVPYESSAQAVQNVLGGHVAMAIVPVPDLIDSDDLRVIARTGDQISLSGWIGIFAPPDTTKQQVDRLAELFHKAADRSRTILEKKGFKPDWRSAEELRGIYASDYKQLLGIAGKIGVEP